MGPGFSSLALGLAWALLPAWVWGHATRDSDRLSWNPPCDFRFPDGDRFEDFSDQQCDFIGNLRPTKLQGFLAEPSLAHQQSFVLRAKQEALEAIKKLQQEKRVLFEETDPKDAPSEKNPQQRALWLAQKRHHLVERAKEIVKPFGETRQQEYLADFKPRADELNRLYNEAKSKLDERGKKILADNEAKWRQERGAAGGLKKAGTELDRASVSEKQRISDKMFAGDIRQGRNRPALPGAASPLPGAASPPPGSEGLARLQADKPGGSQLAKGAALVDKTQSKYANPDKTPPPLQIPDTGGAYEKRGVVTTAKEYARSLLPSPAPQRREQFIQERIIAEGVSERGKKEAEKVIGGMLKNASPEVANNLYENNVHVIVIPEGKKLTDVGPFQQLRGKKTFDGRPWESVEGVADVPMAQCNPTGTFSNSCVAVAIPEKNLIAKGSTDSSGFPKHFSAMHEFGHMVTRYGVPKTAPLADTAKNWMGIGGSYEGPPTQSDFEGAYREAIAGGYGLKDWYSRANADEYLANATAAYFGRGYNGETGADLKRLDPKTYELLERTYGPPTAFG